MKERKRVSLKSLSKKEVTYAIMDAIEEDKKIFRNLVKQDCLENI